MPRFVADARLDQWEEALRPLRGEAGQGPMHAAAVAIFELGRLNLEGAGATPPSETPDFGDW